jgi:DNA-binding transcriptional LysR family regulator
VTPTAAGGALLRRGAEAFDALNQGLRDVAFLSETGSGEVRVGASESYIAGGFLAAAVDRVVRRHPRLTVLVVEANTAGLDFGGLRDRSLDVVLGRMATGGLAEDLELEVLYDEPILLVTGARSRWAQRCKRTVALREVAEGPWVLAPPGSAVHGLVADAFRAAGLQPPAAAVSTYSMQLRMQLLACGDYLTALPASLLRREAVRWELEALPVELGRPLPVAAVTLRRRTLGPVVRLFLEHLRAATQELLATGDVPPQ